MIKDKNQQTEELQQTGLCRQLKPGDAAVFECRNKAMQTACLVDRNRP